MLGDFCYWPRPGQCHKAKQDETSQELRATQWQQEVTLAMQRAIHQA